jgi:hypothetical protein
MELGLYTFAELQAGRGSFTESFPLFGYSLDDYDELFARNLALLLEVRESERVSWTASAGVYPRPQQQQPPGLHRRPRLPRRPTGDRAARHRSRARRPPTCLR